MSHLLFCVKKQACANQVFKCTARDAPLALRGPLPWRPSLIFFRFGFIYCICLALSCLCFIQRHNFECSEAGSLGACPHEKQAFSILAQYFLISRRIYRTPAQDPPATGIIMTILFIPPARYFPEEDESVHLPKRSRPLIFDMPPIRLLYASPTVKTCRRLLSRPLSAIHGLKQAEEWASRPLTAGIREGETLTAGASFRCFDTIKIPSWAMAISHDPC